MEINQERYSALIEMGWEEYQRGDATRMASLLKQSLEYTPYLRVETISDWVSRFGRFALEGEQEFDADYLSDLDEWNQLLFLTLTLDLKQQTLVSTQDEEKNKEKSDRDALYYIFDNQVSRKLTDKAAWVTVSVSPDSHYSCQGNIGSEKDVPKQALVQIQFLNRSKELIQGRYEGDWNTLGVWELTNTYIPLKILRLLKLNFMFPNK